MNMFFDTGVSEIVLEAPFLNLKREPLKYVLGLFCPSHRRILMTYLRDVLVMWPILIFYEPHRLNFWRKFGGNELCSNFAQVALMSDSRMDFCKSGNSKKAIENAHKHLFQIRRH